MSPSIESLRPEQVVASTAPKPLDPAVWEAWLAKGRKRDDRHRALILTALKSAGVVGLLLGVGFLFRR